MFIGQIIFDQNTWLSKLWHSVFWSKTIWLTMFGGQITNHIFNELTKCLLAKLLSTKTYRRQNDGTVSFS
jgi:hypothetical protein